MFKEKFSRTTTINPGIFGGRADSGPPRINIIASRDQFKPIIGENVVVKILANATAIFVPIAVPWDRRKSFPLNWNEFSCRIRLRISLKYLVPYRGITLIKFFVCLYPPLVVC